MQPDLISKLAALANHPNTPPEEAAVARRKLAALLAKHGLTEADITSERLIIWHIRPVKSHAKHLLLSVAGFILNLTRAPCMFAKYGPNWDAALQTNAAAQIDITACFSYYLKILEADRSKIFEEAKLIRTAAKAEIQRAGTLSKSAGKLAELMVHKYEIIPAKVMDVVRELVRRGGPLVSDAKPVKLKPLTKKEEEERRKRWEKDRLARQRMSDHDAWQKGAGLESGTFALEG